MVKYFFRLQNRVKIMTTHQLDPIMGQDKMRVGIVIQHNMHCITVPNIKIIELSPGTVKHFLKTNNNNN